MAMQFDVCAAMFAEIEVELTAEAHAQLNRYAQMLLEEARYQNVTAVRTEEEIWTRHFLDSAYLLRFLAAGEILDIGTGGGIPAIPLAIMNPALRVTMLDSELRKIEFCSRVIETLNLSAQAICGRAEELARDSQYRARFDFAVSRAMASGSMLTELAVPFLKVGGTLLAMKGRHYNEAAECFGSASGVLGCDCAPVHRYTLRGEVKHLIVVHKTHETAEEYPRRFAKIKRAPL